jgi:hypothetical protein
MLKWLALCSAVLMLPACATLVDGPTQEMTFQSNPEGVTVTVTKRVLDYDKWIDRDRVLGKTPLTLQMDREEGQRVIFAKEGYKPVEMKLATETNGTFWGNIVIGGLIGSSIDLMSGAVYQYSQSQFFVSLPPDPNRMDTVALQVEREKAKDFLVRRFTYLVADLSKGEGEDLSATMKVLRVSSGQEGDAKKKLKALSDVYTDPPVFADHVLGLYLQ